MLLASKTSPEAGTVQYTYNGDGTPATQTDAKNQRAVYSYDNYGRVIQIARGTVANGRDQQSWTKSAPGRAGPSTRCIRSCAWMR